MLKERDYYFDNAKFILIVLVVVGHTIRPVTTASDFLYYLYRVFFFFHMPCFVFIVGYFMKYQSDSSKYFLKYIRLYIFIQTLYFIIFKGLFKFQSLALQYSKPYWTYWFLLALIAWYVIFPHINKIKGILWISLIVSIIIGYDSGFGKLLSSSRIIVFFPYFLLGYLTKKETLHYFQSTKWKYVFLILCVISAYLIIPNNLVATKFFLGSSSYHLIGVEQWYAGIYRFFTYIIALLFGITFFSFIPDKQYKISKYGTQTLFVYLSHGIILKSLEVFGLYDFVNYYQLFYPLILFGVILSILLSIIPLRLKMHFKTSKERSLEV